MKPWKRQATSFRCLTGWWLQWGHGDEAVEEAGTAADRAPQAIASMGPRR